MAASERSDGRGGPAIRATDPWRPSESGAGAMHQLLSEAERTRLARIASIVRFKKGEVIYRAGDPANTVFNIISGVVKTYQTDGTEHISAFLFPEDLFGLAEQARYTNSARAISAVTTYALPIPTLRRVMSRDADLEFHVILKLCQDLRQTQRHGLLLAQRRSLSRLTMFLQLMEQLQAARGEATSEIYLPMDRTDIADYIGMSAPAVSRAFRSLTTRRIVATRDRRHVRIINRDGFDRLARAVT